MKMNPVNWFEIAVADIDRAKAFYTATLGYELHDMEMGPAKMAFFPYDKETMGCGGSLTQSDNYKPSLEGTLIYFPVADIEATLSKIENAGGATLTPKTDIGEYGQIAIFQDSEGNRVGLHTPPAQG